MSTETKRSRYGEARERFADAFMKRLARISPYREEVFGYKKPGATPQIYYNGMTIHRYRSQESAYDLRSRPRQKKIVDILIEQGNRPIRGKKLRELTGCATPIVNDINFFHGILFPRSIA